MVDINVSLTGATQEHSQNVSRKDSDLGWKRFLEKESLQLGERQDGQAKSDPLNDQALDQKPGRQNKRGELTKSASPIADQIRKEPVIVEELIPTEVTGASSGYASKLDPKGLSTAAWLNMNNATEKPRSIPDQQPLLKLNTSSEVKEFSPRNIVVLNQQGSKVLVLRDYFSDEAALVEYAERLIALQHQSYKDISQVTINGVKFSVEDQKFVVREK